MIYLADRQLTGSLELQAPDQSRFVLFVTEGTPGKIYSSRQVAPLDRVLLELQLLDETTLQQSLLHVSKSGELHGEYLLTEGLLTPEQLDEALELQIVRKAGAMFGLPPETSFAFYEQLNLLEDYGGAGLIRCDPLRIVMAGVRQSAGDPQVDATLARLGDRVITIHPAADVARLRLTEYEQEVVDLLDAQPLRYADLRTSEVVQERILKLTVYALMVTRSLQLDSTGKPPLSLRPQAMGHPRSSPPSSSPPSRAPLSGLAASQRAAGVFERISTAGRSSPPASAAEPQGSPDAGPGAPAKPSASRAPSSAPPPSAAPTTQRSGGTPPARQPADDRRPPSHPPESGSAPIKIVVAGATKEEVARTSSPSTPAPAPTSSPRRRARGLRIKQTSASPRAEAGPSSAKKPARRPSSPAPRASQPAPSTPPQPARSTPAPPAAGRTAAAPPGSATQSTRPRSAGADRTRLQRDEVEARLERLAEQNHFELLGVEQTAADDEIQQAYLELARRWHPDRLPAELGDLKASVSKVFARMNEAHQTLANAAKRQEYLERLQGGDGTADEDAQVSRLVEAAMDIQKAEVLMKTGDLAGAEKLARSAHEADPEQPEYTALLAWIEAQRLGPPPPGKRSHYAMQIAALNAVLGREPDYEQALFFRGTLLKQSGALDEAMRDFKKVIKLNPKNLDAAREVRIFEMRKGKSPKKKGWGGLFG